MVGIPSGCPGDTIKMVSPAGSGLRVATLLRTKSGGIPIEMLVSA